jgi:streptogramin lyase
MPHLPSAALLAAWFLVSLCANALTCTPQCNGYTCEVSVLKIPNLLGKDLSLEFDLDLMLPTIDLAADFTSLGSFPGVDFELDLFGDWFGGKIKLGSVAWNPVTMKIPQITFLPLGVLNIDGMKVGPFKVLGQKINFDFSGNGEFTYIVTLDFVHNPCTQGVFCYDVDVLIGVGIQGSACADTTFLKKKVGGCIDASFNIVDVDLHVSLVACLQCVTLNVDAALDVNDLSVTLETKPSIPKLNPKLRWSQGSSKSVPIISQSIGNCGGVATRAPNVPPELTLAPSLVIPRFTLSPATPTTRSPTTKSPTFRKHTSAPRSNGKAPSVYAVGSDPMAIATDSGGNVWVANTLDGTVTKLSNTGVTLGTFSVGQGPRCICIDNAGNAWVANWDGGSITKLSPTGSVFGTFIGGDPFALACDQNGYVWVANFYYGTVTKLSSTGDLLGTYSYNLDPHISYPSAIALDSSGNVWVANGGSAFSVTKFSSTGSVLGTYSIGFNPSAIAIDKDANVWMADSYYLALTVTKLGNSGSILDTFSIGESSYGIAFDENGDVWVATGGKSGAIKLSNSGSILSKFTLAGISSAIAVDEDGNAWVANPTENTVTKISA